MFTGAFQHRSGRVIAVGRAVLAIFFLVAILLDPAQPMLLVGETYGLLGFYVGFALLLLVLTWDNWWLESRLAAPAHAIDLLIFLWVNFATRGYASPFFTFFVFLILSASIRWSWRGTAITSTVILILYVASALTEASWGTDSFEVRRFANRSAYLVALSSIVILWLASNQRPAETEAPGGGDDAAKRPPDVAALLRWAAGRLGAQRALFVWTETEEPWVYLARLQAGKVEEEKLQPGSFEPLVSAEAGKGVFLFEQRSGRILQRRGARMRSLDVISSPLHPELASRYAAERGLRIPIRSGVLQGDLFVLDVPGLCSDDLQIAEKTGERIVAALDDRERMQATEEAAAMRARLGLARDLHDSVAQFLAGFTYRLEGMKKGAGAGREVVGEIEALQRELVGEQRDLRRLIAELRGGGGDGAAADLTESLRVLGRRISAQWDVDFIVTAAGEERIEVPPHLERHVGQLVREAAANAVRHGGARRIETRLKKADGQIELEITDNGSGFSVAGEFDEDELDARRIGPLSLRERVRNLRGHLRLRSSPSGATLNIVLPMESPL
ncbi:MAG TPA: histidine kinase [Allosphingosinicella sp.]|jgi:signal transduction histidine kinase